MTLRMEKIATGPSVWAALAICDALTAISRGSGAGGMRRENVTSL